MTMFARLVCAAALLAAGVAPALSASYQCTGTEPFWSLNITSRSIVFKRPDSTVSYRPVAPRPAAGRPLDFVSVYSTTTARAPARPLTAVVRRGACSDGMSDTNYRYSVIVLTPGAVYEGCCRRR